MAWTYKITAVAKEQGSANLLVTCELQRGSDGYTESVLVRAHDLTRSRLETHLRNVAAARDTRDASFALLQPRIGQEAPIPEEPLAPPVLEA